jgi:hypothetical protein
MELSLFALFLVNFIRIVSSRFFFPSSFLCQCTALDSRSTIARRAGVRSQNNGPLPRQQSAVVMEMILLRRPPPPPNFLAL